MSCRLWVVALIVTVLLTSPNLAGDPAAAEEQYRVARRLAASGAAEADAALEEVVRLDPTGVRADDARVEQALLLGVPRWPEELGRIAEQEAASAARLLDRVAVDFPTADRTPEARYYRALLRLEPLTGFDDSRARLELIAVATAKDAGPFAMRARYAMAWLLAQRGRAAESRDAFQRLIVDAPGSEVSVRSRVGLARVLVRDRDYGPAAHWLQEAVEADAAVDSAAGPLRELAVRSLLGTLGTARSGQAQRVATSMGVRVAVGMATRPDGGVVIGDRRSGSVVQYGDRATPSEAWKVEGLKALTVSPQGVLFAVGSDVVYRLESRGVIVRVASLGEFGAPGAIAADGLGRLWLLDRKGTRIGRVDPGTDQPVDAWQGREVRLTALVWDGRRLVGLDTRNQALVAIDPHGSRATLRDGFLKAEALAVDPAGRIAVLDQRSGAVLFYAADGSSLGAWSSQDAGVLRPTAIAFGWGGELHLFDESSASWVVLR